MLLPETTRVFRYAPEAVNSTVGQRSNSFATPDDVAPVSW